MEMDITAVYYALSYALDAVEGEFSGVASGHAKRVAWMVTRMLQRRGVSQEELVDLVGIALLHDNALAQYLREESLSPAVVEEKSAEDLALTRLERAAALHGGEHCILGERYVQVLPFQTDVTDLIRYHHENADGSGPFGLRAGQIPPQAMIVHLADVLDTTYSRREMDETLYGQMRCFVRQNTGTLFTEEAAELFLGGVTFGDLARMRDLGAEACLRMEVPSQMVDYTAQEVENIALFFAHIVDEKSSFTRDHSLGVATKAREMARACGFSEEKTLRFFFAGALHDIGKMIVHNDILEKPGRLDAQEFTQMKDHAAVTLSLLSQIRGLEDITEWAGNHHEKLDGSGYPRGLSADELSFEDRLMGCIDIYQALTEERPYKKGMSHAAAMRIMHSMVADGKIDADITRLMDEHYKEEAQAQEESVSSLPRWKCPVCGYIHEGEEPPVFCPVCFVAGSGFTRMKD